MSGWALSFVTPSPGAPRLVSSLVLRLCFLMVAAFGSRPCDVHTVEQSRSSVVVAGVRERRVVDHDTRIRVSAASLRLPARSGTGLRVSTVSAAGSANVSPVEFLARTTSWRVLSARAALVVRRTPCAACGDGNPYDATAPPASSARA